MHASSVPKPEQVKPLIAEHVNSPADEVVEPVGQAVQVPLPLFDVIYLPAMHVQVRLAPDPALTKPALHTQVDEAWADGEYKYGQFVQDDAAAAEYVLTPQDEHTKPLLDVPDEVYPALQMQVVAVPAEVEDAGQLVQDDAPAAEYVLTPQDEHTKPLPDVPDEVYPALHRQVAAVPAEVEDAGQFVQDDDPAEAEYVLTPQALQVPLPLFDVIYLPAMHVQVRLAPDPALTKPALHTQVDEAWADGEYKYGQFVQDDAAAAEYVLTPQGEHTKPLPDVPDVPDEVYPALQMSHAPVAAEVHV